MPNFVFIDGKRYVSITIPFSMELDPKVEKRMKRDAARLIECRKWDDATEVVNYLDMEMRRHPQLSPERKRLAALVHKAMIMRDPSRVRKAS